MADHTDLSVYLCWLLRHNPDSLGLDMDVHGWVSTRQLVEKVDAVPGRHLDMVLLEKIVSEDPKGRYRMSPDGSRIKCCQGHSLAWVEPELIWQEPPAILYHGTTEESWVKIRESGAIVKMDRHHVHMTASLSKAWQSARRRKKQCGVVLVVDSEAMHQSGFAFGCTENNVWCTERVPVAFVRQVLRDTK